MGKAAGGKEEGDRGRKGEREKKFSGTTGYEPPDWKVLPSVKHNRWKNTGFRRRGSKLPEQEFEWHQT